jgi:hypothetical protein
LIEGKKILPIFSRMGNLRKGIKNTEKIKVKIRNMDFSQKGSSVIEIEVKNPMDEMKKKESPRSIRMESKKSLFLLPAKNL